jgi:MFS family permease
VKSELLRLISGQIFLHACMTGMRLATPLLALQQGYSAMAVGVLLALFSVTQVFMAIPAGKFTDRHGAVALLQSQEWRGQTHACHASVQKNLSAD